MLNKIASIRSCTLPYAANPLCNSPSRKLAGSNGCIRSILLRFELDFLWNSQGCYLETRSMFSSIVIEAQKTENWNIQLMQARGLRCRVRPTSLVFSSTGMVTALGRQEWRWDSYQVCNISGFIALQQNTRRFAFLAENRSKHKLETIIGSQIGICLCAWTISDNFASSIRVAITRPWALQCTVRVLLAEIQRQWCWKFGSTLNIPS